MRSLLLLDTLAALLLAGCEQRPAATTAAPAAPSVATVAARLASPALDTLDYTRPLPGAREVHPDTLIALGSRHYWLQTRQVSDSTRPFDYGPTAIAGRHFAAPSDSAWRQHRVRGYDGTYTFTLRDSSRRQVIFRQQLHKKDLQAGSPAEVLAVSEPDFYYRGYSLGLGALLFVLETGIPDSDVIHRAALLLDARTGRVRALPDIGSASFEATDCAPRVSGDGQSILTCANELLRAGRPPVSLRRSHAEVRAATFLTDTTLLVVYAFGDYRPTKPAPGDSLSARASNPDDPRISAGFYVPNVEFHSTPAQRQAPNAFIYGTSGHVLSKFNYDGWISEMGEVLPIQALAATRTYYLVSHARDLVLLPRAQPGTVRKIPIKSLPRFRPPQRPQEAALTLYSERGQYTFYVDKINPQAIRYQLAKFE